MRLVRGVTSLIFLSLYEGFGLSLFEVLTAGTPPPLNQADAGLYGMQNLKEGIEHARHHI